MKERAQKSTKPVTGFFRKRETGEARRDAVENVELREESNKNVSDTPVANVDKITADDAHEHEAAEVIEAELLSLNLEWIKPYMADIDNCLLGI